jgi:predicted Zn finger-like uncharacterized protein
VQANCPKCSYRITVDDAKAPDRPFNVRCPKCQNAVRFPGKAAAEAASAPRPPAAPSAPEAPAAPSPAPSAPGPVGGPPVAKEGERALVALPERDQAGAVTLCLNRLGFAVETLVDSDEGARLLEQGVFSVVTTHRAAAQGGQRETLYQRINRLPSEARRKLFVVLVGNEFRTGEGTQAFATLADLVVSSQDAGSMDAALRSAHGERTRLYQAFNDAVQRHERHG